jgi:branched-subunit amino acid ABC-type transport system permease component
MTLTLALVQILNGLQFGLILFLIAAGLTLVFGVMDSSISHTAYNIWSVLIWPLPSLR